MKLQTLALAALLVAPLAPSALAQSGRAARVDVRRAPVAPAPLPTLTALPLAPRLDRGEAGTLVRVTPPAGFERGAWRSDATGARVFEPAAERPAELVRGLGLAPVTDYDPASFAPRPPELGALEWRTSIEQRLRARERDEQGRIVANPADDALPEWRRRARAWRVAFPSSAPTPFAQPALPRPERMVPSFDDFERVDRNGDGALNADELRAAPSAHLVRDARLPFYDKNGDGRLSADEAIPGARVLPRPVPTPELFALDFPAFQGGSGSAGASTRAPVATSVAPVAPVASGASAAGRARR